MKYIRLSSFVVLLFQIDAPVEAFSSAVSVSQRPSATVYRVSSPLKMAPTTDAIDSLLLASNSLQLATDSALVEPSSSSTNEFVLSPAQTILVFIIGLVPFGFATVEFWRRIAFGESFGTGKDSIVFIGKEGDATSSRGQRVLGNDSLIVAYILFAIAAAVLGVVLVAVVTSPVPTTGVDVMTIPVV